jgi:hypothetical protein
MRGAEINGLLARIEPWSSLPTVELVAENNPAQMRIINILLLICIIFLQ